MQLARSIDGYIQEFKVQFSELFSERELRHVAKSLLEKVTDIPFENLPFEKDRVLSETQFQELQKLEGRLKEGIPLQYILGYSYFADLKIGLEENVLIPRPETEELVYWIKESHPNLNEIHDMCSGSGCIALALKSMYSQARIQASDLSVASLKQIEKTSKYLHLPLDIVQFDLLRPEYSQVKTSEIITCNPPYIPEDERVLMSKHVLNHEPGNALFVPNNSPLLFYESALVASEKLLQENGWIYFEIHESYGAEMLELMTKFGYSKIEIKKDLQGKDRMMRGQKT